MKYDIIIAGAGLGGLSFLNTFMEGEFPDWRILVIDQDRKDSNDRTWSFWTTSPPHLSCAGSLNWQHLGFASDNFQRYDQIAPYRYYTIRGIDFYNEVLSKARAHANIHFVQDEILAITQRNNEVRVRTRQSVHEADHVIDSITRPKNISDYLCNSQNFLGWEIKVPRPTFEVTKPLLMDFRVAQSEAPSFVYVLPYSETEALVEYTQFSKTREFDQKQYAVELQSYIQKVMGLEHYDTYHEEQGAIPMTNYPFTRRLGRVFRIGTVGGDTKPTTGYTFMNVQKHAIEILDILSGKEVKVASRPRFRFYDNLLLEIIAHAPQAVKPIMTRLFQSQPMHRVLKFLHEDSNLAEEIGIFAQLPWAPFLKALKDQTYAIFTENDRADAHSSRELVAR
ncbi:MAG: lycopene cyclase family protein [Bacteroidota bacterium]